MQQNYKVGNYELDNTQMQLIQNNENCLVIAGAGSGKTLTILGKVNYLIENQLCRAEEILIISFTNASVNDIKSRIIYNVNVYTFHKLAMHILEKANFKYSLCSTNTLKYIIQEILKSINKENQEIILKFMKLNLPYSKFLKSKYFKSFCSLVETFINLYKSNNFRLTDIQKIKFNNLQKRILLIIFNIYYKYNSEKFSVNQLDFDDLISYATNLVEKSKLHYKYIIIDEFQDTSFIRLNLIKTIFNYTNAKIVVVGDDWQSIYRFSGCDLNIFLNFTKEFPNVTTINLINTYRNSLELISIASKFIQQNPHQIKKHLTSAKSNKYPIIFVPYTNKIQILKRLLNELTKKSESIMILSRNNNDIYEYIDYEYKLENATLYYRQIPIKYYTVHKSKGLEADNVIILNCNNGVLGFPNKIENNPIIDKLLINNEIPFAEERRLFYVAITRCKCSTYLIYERNNPSVFIKEIKKITKRQQRTIKYFK